MINMKGTLTRRQMLGGLATSLPLVCALPPLFGAGNAGPKRLGICTYSYNLHWKAGRDGDPKARFKDPLEFLEYCHQLGAGGVQMAIGSRDAEYVARLRTRAEAWGMYLEGELSLPKEQSDVARFDAEVRAARQAGAQGVRTAMMGGRRYETFDSADAFRQFAEKSWRSLTLAEPVLKKHRARLAIENHKDRRVLELLDLLKRISSEHVGVCLDTGNNIALLEEPMAVVEALAPFAFSTHLKDMAVQECEEGFLLSEVPLGDDAVRPGSRPGSDAGDGSSQCAENAVAADRRPRHRASTGDGRPERPGLAHVRAATIGFVTAPCRRRPAAQPEVHVHNAGLPMNRR